jgi:HEAT repeat protein
LILKELLAQRENQKAFRALALRYSQEALQSESDAPDNAIAAAHLLDSFQDPAAIPVLLRFLRNRDPEVVAVCAESLAGLKAKEAREPLTQLLAKVPQDPRFAPMRGRPDPRDLVARIEKALDAIAHLP